MALVLILETRSYPFLVSQESNEFIYEIKQKHREMWTNNSLEEYLRWHWIIRQINGEHDRTRWEDVFELVRGYKFVNYTCVGFEKKRTEQAGSTLVLGERKTERFSVGRLLAYGDTN